MDFKFELGQIVLHTTDDTKFLNHRFLVVARYCHEELGVGDVVNKCNCYRVRSHNTPMQEWVESEMVAFVEKPKP